MKALILLFSILGVVSAQAVTQEVTPVAVMLKDAKGVEVGEAVLSKDPHGVKVVLNVKNLTPGQHALHFHQNGLCTPPDFKSAGDHFSPKKRMHGFETKGGPHEGDMKNFEVQADGTARYETVATMVALDEKSLLKKEGTSIVIHAKADDYKSQPAGNAGDRIACGEIKGI